MGGIFSSERLDKLEKRVEALERKVGPTVLPVDLKKEITNRDLYKKKYRYSDVYDFFCWP